MPGSEPKIKEKNYYERLCVPMDASSSQIRQAFLEFAQVYHPDSKMYSQQGVGDLTNSHLDLYKYIVEAYNTLSIPDKRAEYDKNLQAQILIGSDEEFQKLSNTYTSKQFAYDWNKLQKKNPKLHFHSYSSLITDSFLLSLFASLLALIFAVYFYDRESYLWLMDEDGPINWSTTIAWLLTSVGGFFLAIKAYREALPSTLFCIGLSLIAAIVGLEEINWGQRLLHTSSPDTIASMVGHKEISLHYILTGMTGVPIQFIAGCLLVLYGIAAPLIIASESDLSERLSELPIYFPPVSLISGFSLAAFLMLTSITGLEEEIGELFFSLSFLFFVAIEYFEVDDIEPAELSTHKTSLVFHSIAGLLLLGIISGK